MSTSDKKYKIIEDPLVGRHLIATRDIFPGESIIDEPPLVSGPVSNYNGLFPTFTNIKSPTSSEQNQCNLNVCPVCCFYIKPQRTDASTTCDKCNIPLCSISCKNDPLHCLNECQVFQKIPKTQIPWSKKKILYNFINTIRCLFVRVRSPSVKWSQIVQLESKVKDLEKVGAFTNDLDLLFGLLKWEYFVDIKVENSSATTSPLPKESIVNAAKHCLGVMRTNAFSSFTESYAREGLYFLSSLMSHSCIMNTDRQTDHERMVTKAAKVIKKGHPITTSYLSYMNGTYERFTETKSTWFFVCTCTRCKDPTECGTNMSTVSCPSCNQVTLKPHVEVCDSDTCSYELLWKCSNGECNYVLSPANTISIPPSLDLVEQSRPSQLTNSEEVEKWLDSCDNGTIVHSNHSVIIQVKLYLCQYYGRNNEGISGLSSNRLGRKVKYSMEVLEILDILFNGVYMLRGIILFELWSALEEINHRVAQKEESTILGDFLKLIDYSNIGIDKIRQDSLSILTHALPNSSEEFMARILSQHCT